MVRIAEPKVNRNTEPIWDAQKLVINLVAASVAMII